MKITIHVEATPQEMRECLGLPNVQPLQDVVVQKLVDNMQRGVAGFDALSLMKPMMPPHLQSMDQLQKAFWDAFVKASNQYNSKDSPGEAGKSPEATDSS
ncbi:MAG: DUF6489 family protein [Candidatus Competibacterales bacterium]